MYSYFTFLELVKAISVHRAHRLLSEATPILCTWRNRLSVTVSGFNRLLSGNATNYRRKNTRFVSSNDRYRDCPFHLLLLNGCGFCRFPNSPAAPRLWDSRGQETVNLLQNTPPSAFTDEVNCIIDNEKQKALLVDVRSPRTCVTMPSAANQ
jgi:hypothetical protein